MVYKKNGEFFSTCGGEAVVYGDMVIPAAIEENPVTASTSAIFDVDIEEAATLVRGQSRRYEGSIPIEEYLPFVNFLWLIRAIHAKKLHAVTSGNSVLYRFDFKELKNLRDEIIQANGKNPLAEKDLYGVGYDKTRVYFSAFESEDEAKEFMNSISEKDIQHCGDYYFIKFNGKTVMAKNIVTRFDKEEMMDAVWNVKNMQIFLNSFKY